MTSSTTTSAAEEDDDGQPRHRLASYLDLAAVTVGAAMSLTAITILATWPWALLAAGLALIALGTVVI